MDIEDLKELGERLSICPYYYSKLSIPTSDFIIAPYAYVLDPFIYSQMQEVF